MSLNPDQKSAVEWITKNILEQREKYMTLVGAGGTGKTHCIMTAVEDLLAAGLKVILTAPTNKAVKQLEKAARTFGLSTGNVAFQTTHSALGLALLPNEDRKHAVKAGKGVIGVFDVVVVDEASMLAHRALFDHLIPACEEHGASIVFMGDDLQLPPPREPVSRVFTEFPMFRLEQNMRQGEGRLLSMNGALREAMMQEKPFKAPEADGQQILATREADFMKEVLANFDGDTDLDAQRVLAWTNRRVGAINQAIRQKIYGKGCPRFMEGERVVTGSPVKDPDTNEILIGTDEECLVHHVDEEAFVFDEESGSDYRTTRLVLKPIFAEIDTVIVYVLHADENDRYHKQLDDMATAAKNGGPHSRQLWAKFWGFKELFADIRYCYCITVHRSQGSTFDRVFVDVKDILTNRKRSERQRLVYVAYSRPRHQLILNKRSYVA